MNPIDNIEAGDLKKGLPQLTPGDTVRVHVRVKETSVKEEIKGKPKETERERVLAHAEVRALWAAAGSIGYPFGTFLQL